MRVLIELDKGQEQFLVFLFHVIFFSRRRYFPVINKIHFKELAYYVGTILLHMLITSSEIISTYNIVISKQLQYFLLLIKS